ncbi:hypothetical protein CASFOL_013256 [Castilleja foliolosa]|uniref:F-box domain-containing protein n=1 Tax=Castilleja foliolosa TaxID=1961234 RepID=A0ABD3DJG8_9LAMI
MANSVLPEELMLCILTRLPVKTIIRFKSVCKPWFHLFSTPEFKKLHQTQFSSDPKNQSFIVHTFDRQYNEPKNQFSIFNIESGQKRPTILDHPFAQKIELYTVGCCNGLVCIRRGHEIVLWNPAMKLSKTIPLKDCAPFKMASLGFGYDATGDDFKVVMILTNIDGDPIDITSAEIYSVNLGSWISIDTGIQFSWCPEKNNLIVNGNMYWDNVLVDGDMVLVCFDVLELVFKFVPVSTTYWDGMDEETETKWRDVKLDDWNGALSTLIINFEIEENVGPPGTKCCARVECFEVRVFDDIERIWRKKHTFGPIEVDGFRVLRCIKNEKILGLTSYDKLIVLDLETGSVKELFDGASADANIGNMFEVYGYTESLTYINGMEKVVVKNEQNDIDD